MWWVQWWLWSHARSTPTIDPKLGKTGSTIDSSLSWTLLETWIKALITSVIGGLNPPNKGPDFRQKDQVKYIELNLGEFSLIIKGLDRSCPLIGSLHNLSCDLGWKGYRLVDSPNPIRPVGWLTRTSLQFFVCDQFNFQILDTVGYLTLSYCTLLSSDVPYIYLYFSFLFPCLIFLYPIMSLRDNKSKPNINSILLYFHTILSILCNELHLHLWWFQPPKLACIMWIGTLIHQC